AEAPKAPPAPETGLLAAGRRAPPRLKKGKAGQGQDSAHARPGVAACSGCVPPPEAVGYKVDPKRIAGRRMRRMQVMAREEILDLNEYKYGFREDDSNYFYRSEKGLSREIVEQISRMKNEPDWMREFRLKAYEIFLKKPMPTWGADLSELDFDEIYYYVRSTERKGRSWDEVPEEIKRTFDRLGIPEAERKFLAGVSAQYESEVVYESMREDLEKQGVVFCSMDTAVQKHPELVREYFGTVVPPMDNKF